MSQPPAAEDGVDAAALEAVNATLESATDVGEQQSAQAERAEEAGARSDRVTLAILLGALAASLCALAAAAPTKRYTSLDLASLGVLVMALPALASVPFV